MSETLAKTRDVKIDLGTVLIPIAVGELADKITILQIKAERITDREKLKNVSSELNLLQDVWKQSGALGEHLDELVRHLKIINEALWQIEDDVRDCERNQDFGAQFIELARAVYRNNDRRFELKRRINDLAGSKIVEEKSYRPY